MKTFNQLIFEIMNKKNVTRENAESLVCQHVILNKIQDSSLKDSIFLKGGVVMYKLTSESRRATNDMDFDLIHYDISNEESLKSFIRQINDANDQYSVIYDHYDRLKHDDYHGARVFVIVSDGKRNIKYHIDIGINSFPYLKQNNETFVIVADEPIFNILVNPPEEMLAEKLYSIAKLCNTYGRAKEIYDVYYIINKFDLDHKLIKQIFETLTKDGKHNLKNFSDVKSKTSTLIQDRKFEDLVMNSNRKWIDVSYEEMKTSILNFLNSIT